MSPSETALEQARRHVAEGEARVSAQEQLVAELSRDGHDTTSAAELLATLRVSLTIMREHLAVEEEDAARRG